MVDIDLEEIMDHHREVEGKVRAADEEPPASTRKGKGRESNESRDSASGHDLWETQHRGFLVPGGHQDHRAVLRGERNPGEPGRRTTNGKGKEREFPQEDPHVQFYEHYRKEAEEYDRELMKKYNDDLNTTLIFAGLLSAATSAFLIRIHSPLQPDPTDETAALLRVLLYNMDNAMFGGNTSPPQWTGAPHTIIQVQAMLYASLATSGFSAFFAVLCKRQLNRYASTAMRRNAVGHDQDRQREPDGIFTWNFYQVMESLPVILQLSFLLLGCALSRYLWEIYVIVARIVLGVTVFGVIF